MDKKLTEYGANLVMAQSREIQPWMRPAPVRKGKNCNAWRAIVKFLAFGVK